MFFRDIVGHTALRKRLALTVQEDRLGHAWLFFGPEGSGSLPLALAFARYILCTEQGEDDACGHCASCQKINKYVHPDLHFSFPVNKTKSMDKDEVGCNDFLPEWRSFLINRPYDRLTGWYDAVDLENKQGIINLEESRRLAGVLNLKPFESEYKVAIIWQPEKMNAQAGNRLLKLLEEPPPNTVFILAAENPDLVLPTIASRCIPIKVPRIDDASMKEVLTGRHGLNPEKAETVSRIASGSYLRALELISDEEDVDQVFVRFRDLMRLCFSRNLQGLMKAADELASMTREKQKTFLEYGLYTIRESLALHFDAPGMVYIAGRELEFTPKFAPYITGANITAITRELNAAISDIERNGNGRIIFLDLVLKLTALIRQ
jgi:DNA polymerase-3 subunit delta'